MRKNKILNVMTLIAKRYPEAVPYTDNVIKDVLDTVNEVFGKNYISGEDVACIIGLMSKYN